jgi:hypothetical protein
LRPVPGNHPIWALPVVIGNASRGDEPLSKTVFVGRFSADKK